MRRAILGIMILCAHASGQDTRARDLAAASAEAVKGDPELAVLLAREALSAADIEPSRTALYAALMNSCKCTVLSGHEGAVWCGDISPDGQLAATGSEDGTARLWTLAGEQAATLAVGAPVKEVRFVGPDHVMAATEAALSIWDRAGRKLAEFPPAPHEVVADGLLLLPEGQVRFVGADGKVARELEAIRGGLGGGDIAFHAFTADGRVRWYDRAGKEKAVKPATGTSAIAFAASGALVATWGGGNAVELWSPDGKKVAELAHGGAVEQVAISPAGDRILSGAADGQFSFWTGAGKLKRRVPKAGQEARFITASSPCGICVALAGKDYVMLSYPTLDSGDEIVVKHVGGQVRSIDVNPTGHGVRVEDADGKSHFLFWTTLDEVKVRNSLRGELTVSRWGNQGDWQAYGDDKGKVALYHWGRVRPLGLRGHTGAILDLRFSADDRRLLTTSRDGTARLWEIDSPEMPTIYHPRNGVSGVGYTTTNTIVTVDWTAMHLWQRDGRPIRSFAVPEYMSGWAVGQGAAFAPAGGNAATLFDTVSGKEIGQLRHDGPIRAITRSWPKFDRFATYSFDDQTVRIWDTSGKRRAVLKHPSGILTGTFGTDGSFLTIAEDSHVRIWSSSGRLREEFQVPGEVASCLWSPKGDRLLTSHDEARTLRLWTAKGKEVGTLAERSLPAQAWGFTWQGDEILTASGSTVRLWDKDGRSTKVIEHPDRVGMGMFLCDRDGFVTGCDDGLVRHWDLEGKLLAVMDGHKGIGITCADFTDDGAFLATGADDGTVRIWPLKRDDLSRIARDRVSRDFTPAERERFAALLAK